MQHSHTSHGPIRTNFLAQNCAKLGEIDCVHLSKVMINNDQFHHKQNPFTTGINGMLQNL